MGNHSCNGMSNGMACEKVKPHGAMTWETLIGDYIC